MFGGGSWGGEAGSMHWAEMQGPSWLPQLAASTLLPLHRKQPLDCSLTRVTLLDNPLPAPSWRTPSCGALWTAACPRRRSASILFRT